MRIFITGGSTGIGMYLARLYLKEGHEVGVCARSQEKFDRSFADLDPEERKHLQFFSVEVTEREKMLQCIQKFSQAGLDLIIANAGISMGQKSAVPDFLRARAVIETNVLGVLNTFEGALPLFMKQKGGHLVAIASVAGLAGFPGTAAYSASKSAVITLCETFSIDLHQYGITTSCICPGFIDTPLTQSNTHAMPFLLSLETGARLIKRAIDQKKEFYAFPWQMKILTGILYHLPRTCYRKLMRMLNLDLTKS